MGLKTVSVEREVNFNGFYPYTLKTPAIGTLALRASYAGTGAMTSGSTSLTTGVVYMQYE